MQGPDAMDSAERDLNATLSRIADALERLAPAEPAPADARDGSAFTWTGRALRAVTAATPQPLDRLIGVEAQKAALLANATRLADGLPAHDVLLWGARGMGKSALVKSVHAALAEKRLGLVEAARDDLATLPALFDVLGASGRPFLVFVDDLSFEANDPEYKALRSLLDGGLAARPANVRLHVTSNRRHLVARDIAENDAAINARDVADDRLALADRFGLSLGFHNADQPTYLAIVRRYAEALGLPYDEHAALAWSVSRGGRSGRVAWQYTQEAAGLAGVRL